MNLLINIKKLIQKTPFRLFLFVVLIFLLFFLSYVREVLFLQINALISDSTNNYSNVNPHEFLKLYKSQELINLKWILTGLFSIVFFGLTYLLIFLSFNNKIFTRLFFYFSIFVSLFSIVITFIFTAAHAFKTIYPLLRKIIGFIHSPALFIIFFIIFYSLKSTQTMKISK